MEEFAVEGPVNKEMREIITSADVGEGGEEKSLARRQRRSTQNYYDGWIFR